MLSCLPFLASLQRLLSVALLSLTAAALFFQRHCELFYIRCGMISSPFFDLK